MFLSSLMLQVFAGFILKADYAINRAIYIQSCINKDKPVLKCNGKCQLGKKILAAEKEQQRAAEKGSYQFNLSVEILCNKIFILSLNELGELNNPLKFHDSITDELIGHYKAIFHPPQLV
ncbi:hypothetical protein [Sediminibacterium sp.]|uniref:hypothetical protein n=1 Tax=Sediminibacterium sp. TaxID=1917865 RepID=UPI00273739AB|nr:hypothetical protein [Sediminibacterium sp.]MDP3394571.1 hypothetical protein [Sediminibacterium sp.]MDP3568406.1 hypothetical protein [Sediminibacterium sp.]